MTTGKIIMMVSVAALTAAVPLGLMGYLHHKKGARWFPFLTGAVFFPLFAMGLERVFHSLVLGSPLGGAISGNIWLYALYGGLAAGIFEEAGRLAAFRLVLKDRREPVTALSYGLGHGGMEAFLLVGLTMIANLSLGLAHAAGTLPPEAAEMMFFWAGFERMPAIILHVSNSVLVFASVWTGRRWLFPAAILTHAAVNFIAVTSASALPVAATELLVLACSLLTALAAWRIYRKLAQNVENA